MRQGQQHRRGRGRNNNNNNNHRKGHNPLSRSFESNGPDVKVRGTPAHIAEKYLSLARDAQSSGDPVLAENYFQHAEHYNRIIMAYREQQMQQSGDMMNGGGAPRMRPGGPFEGGEGEEGHDEETDDLGHGEQPPIASFQQEQPRFQGPRGDDDRPHRHDHGRFRDRNDRHNRHERSYDRQNDTRNEMRQGRDRSNEGQQGRDRNNEGQPPPEGGPQQTPQSRSDQPPQRRRERFGPGNEQPDFLRRPVRRPRREGGNGEEENVEAGREDGPEDKTSA